MTIIVGIIIVSGFCFCPVWYYLTPRYGKRNIWLTGAMWLTIANVLFIAIGEGSIYIAILFSVLAGITLGTRFLADSILADIIDYDEFLSGQRNEAFYTMFKTLLPKLVSETRPFIPCLRRSYPSWYV